MLTDAELYILSYYRACELAGSVLFGRLALHTDLDSIRSKLTHHCLEEAEHGWMWDKTIQDLGHTPIKVTEIYQTELGKEFGMPKNILEILALTQIFEKRTLMHFSRHLNMPDVNKNIKAALKKMIEDEQGHLSWVKEELDKYTKEHDNKTVEETMKKLEEIDEKVYAKILKKEPMRSYFKNAE